jgi:hypothetical protein
VEVLPVKMYSPKRMWTTAQTILHQHQCN